MTQAEFLTELSKTTKRFKWSTDTLAFGKFLRGKKRNIGKGQKGSFCPLEAVADMKGIKGIRATDGSKYVGFMDAGAKLGLTCKQAATIAEAADIAHDAEHKALRNKMFAAVGLETQSTESSSSTGAASKHGKIAPDSVTGTTTTKAKD